MDSNRRLFVGNLPFQVLERDLEDQFRNIGTVVSVNLMLDKETGRSRGFAFVEFSTAEEAAQAVEQLNGKDLGGRAMTVNIARPREERPAGGRPRSGGGGYGGGGGGGRGGGGYGGGGGGGGGGYRGDRGGRDRGDRGSGGGGDRGGWRGDRD